MINEHFNFYDGWVEGELICNKTQKVLLTLQEHLEGDSHNMVMQRAGIALAAALKGQSPTLNFMAVGTGGSSEVNTAIKLDSELSRSPVTIIFDTTTSGVLQANGWSNRLKVSATFDNTVVGSITEMAIFAVGTPTSDSGIMLSRKKISTLAKTAETSLKITWNLVF